MTTIACVKAGTKYSAEYVNRLRRAVAANGLGHLRFACLTDDPTGLDPEVVALPLDPRPEGWWHKLYFFAHEEHGLNDALLTLDLDMVVVKDLSCLAGYHGPFTMSASLGPCRGTRRPPGLLSSTVMYLPRGFGRHVWREFAHRPEQHMHRDPERTYGDQWFIERMVGTASRFQDLWPRFVVSYRYHCRGARRRAGTLRQNGRVFERTWLPPGPPEEARLVSFHGKPDPHEVNEEWVRRCWTEI